MRRILSGSDGGEPIKVAATSSPGTAIHTVGTGRTQRLTLQAVNTDNTDRLLTLQWGGTDEPDNSIEITVPSGGGDRDRRRRPAARLRQGGSSVRGDGERGTHHRLLRGAVMSFLARAFGRFWKVEARQFVDADTGAEIVGHSEGSGAPLGDPGAGNRVYLDTDDGSLYTWDGAAWAAVSGSSLDGVTDGPNDNVYLGSNQTVGTGDDNVMIGADMDAQNDPYRAVAVGHQCAPLGPSCVVVGRLAYASDFGTAIGNGAGAGVSGTALGNGAVATDDGIAIGDGVSALADEAVIGGASHTLRSGGQIAIEVVALAPAADPGFAGVVKYCTADSKLYIWTGAAWRSIATV